MPAEPGSSNNSGEQDEHLLTLAEYMSAERFPLTTQGNLSPESQMMINAFNLDQGRAAIADGYQLTDKDRQRLAELEEKSRHMPRLLDELRAKEQGNH